jgi:hypothetical protein
MKLGANCGHGISKKAVFDVTASGTVDNREMWMEILPIARNVDVVLWFGWECRGCGLESID